MTQNHLSQKIAHPSCEDATEALGCAIEPPAPSIMNTPLVGNIALKILDQIVVYNNVLSLVNTSKVFFYTFLPSNIIWWKSINILKNVNIFRTNDYCTAVKSLYWSFDRSCQCESFLNPEMDTEKLSEEVDRGFRYAALNLAALHANFQVNF